MVGLVFQVRGGGYRILFLPMPSLKKIVVELERKSGKIRLDQ